MSEKRKYKIKGTVTGERDGCGVPDFRVEAWDKDMIVDDLLGTAITDENGGFTISFDETYYQEICFDRKPDIYFKVFSGDELVCSTEDSVLWNVETGNVTINIPVSIEHPQKQYAVKGRVTDKADNPLPGLQVQAIQRYLRKETLLGSGRTNEQGEYSISCFVSGADEGGLNLMLRVSDREGKLLHQTEVHHNVPKEAEIDIQLPTVFPGFSGFERMARTLQPLLEKGLTFVDLEQDDEHDDISFLSGETGIKESRIARFVIAHKLATQSIQAEFWFALLGGSFYQYAENQSLKNQLAAVLDSLSSLDAIAVRKALTRAFNLKEIPETFREKVSGWVEAFLEFVAGRSVSGAGKPTFVKLALADAGIKDAKKQEKFARLFNDYKALTPELLETLEKDQFFKKTEIADLRTSFKLSEITNGDFSVVKAIKQTFDVRQPERIRSLAKISEEKWVNLVKERYDAGEIKLPFEVSELPGQTKLPEAEIYGKMLERRFREVFPTTAFAGGLERALSNGGAKGLRHAKVLSKFLDAHEDFELLNTPVDDFLDKNIHPDFKPLAKDEGFRLEVKAIQRVFKLAPTFEATHMLLADDLHSAQKVYRMGKTEFVRHYAGQAGFTKETAHLAWNRAADTHAAALTIIGDLNEFDARILPEVLKSGSSALKSFPNWNNLLKTSFPNWNNLFKTGDLCECEHCRSVLSPAAYFTDLLMFLKDRESKKPKPDGTGNDSVKDILFARRPDLGFLELNCDNALTPLPYIDVVCEVLEDVVDATDENDIELTGFTLMPSDPTAAKTAVAQAFKDAFTGNANVGKEKIDPGADFSLSQVDPQDPDRWVIHADNVSYLLKKKAASNFFAEILRNTKASAAELRSYPQYVNPKAYEKLREAKYPSALPFDLFAEDVRAAFQKTNLQRWDLMRTLRSAAAPNNPSEGEIAAEYFGISADPAAAFDEKRLILTADPTVAGQQTVWGETGTGWLNSIGNVKIFLRKAGLEYNELLALLDLKFINPDGDIGIHHSDSSCDTDKQSIRVLDAEKLDRIHRFLRLWRKLKGWQMWELDLVIRHPAIGSGALDEPFLVHLFYFDRLKRRLGKKTTVEQVCALFGNLNTETRFTKLHKKREDGLYQSLFLNRRLIQPLDTAFQINPGTGDLLPGKTITDPDHLPVVIAALGISESDLILLKGLTRASNGKPYINDDLTLTNLSFLWRHAWLSRLLKFKKEEWKIVLKIFQQDILYFANPQAAWAFLEGIDHLKAAGFKPDELNWLLAADRSAKAATKESDAARFLTALRKKLQQIKTEYDPAQHDFLTVTPPTDVDKLTALLTSLLQKLNRDEADTQFFIATLRDEVGMEATVSGLPHGFSFPKSITGSPKNIRIRYNEPGKTLSFTGLMSDSDKTTLLSLSSVKNLPDYKAYRDAIEEFFARPRLALKFFEPVFTAPLADLPAAVDFKALPDASLARKISYDAEQRLLRFAGIMSKEEKAALDDLSPEAAYRNAVDKLATQPGSIAPPDERIWLTDNDLNAALPANDTFAKRLANAAGKALDYLSKTLTANAVVQQSSTQLGLTEALTRRLLTHYAVLPVLPDTLMTQFTGAFAATTGVVDYATLKTTFDGWFWANRVAAIWNAWKITFAELGKITTLTAGAQLLDFKTLPLNEKDAIASIDRFLRTSRLLRLRDSVPETGITLLEVLENLSKGTYATATDFAVDVERLNEVWLSVDVEALTASLDLAYPADYLLAESWERLRRAFYFLDNLNAGADTVKTFAAAAMGHEQAKTIKELLRSKFGTETWLTLSSGIQDVLRERKRDALAAYLLLAQPKKPTDVPSGKWENTNDLYAYYLLDIEMSSCQLTSRLVQGSGSIQLFVQRCFMGLEPDVKVEAGGDDGDSAWRWWKWMSKYRVWEANRKVFLWPENWIEPELKKDRSPFFKDLENELLQNEINQYNVEKAFTGYLEKLEGVAQLEIAGFYQEDDGDDTVIHVFGRTPGAEPHLYYYRRYDYSQWTPWEKVDLDIQGDYLIPAVLNQRLFLFWPVFTEVPDETENNKPVPVPVAPAPAPAKGINWNELAAEFISVASAPAKGTTNPTTMDAPVKKTKKKLRLQMAVSDYRQGKWTPKRISKDFGESGSYYDVEIVRKHYRFLPIDRSEVDGRFGINYTGDSLDRDGNPKASLNGAFEITGCKGVPELVQDLDAAFLPAVRPEQDSTGPYPSFMKWVELWKPPNNDFTLENPFYYQAQSQHYTPVLKQTPSIFRISPPWHTSYFDRFLIDVPPELAAKLLTIITERTEPLGTLGRSNPVGSWLPFFYNDKKRTFFVLPSLSWENKEDKLSTVGRSGRHYYPDIKGVFRKWADSFEGEIQKWLNGITFIVDRSSIEQFLKQAFPEEAPPYTDKQLKKLLMRSFHDYLAIFSLIEFQSKSRYFNFKNYYHPFVCDFARLVYNPLQGIPALMSRKTQLKDSGFSFENVYQPENVVVKLPPQYPPLPDCYPREVVDFTPDGAYSSYNWELFFHAPLLIANLLSKNQRFEEARDWYHFMFNPIGVETVVPGGPPSTMSKYWITKPFFETTDQQYVQQRIDNILRMLAGDTSVLDTSVPGYSAQVKKNLETEVHNWRTNPFEPHRIANYRTVAYQKTVVMKYLDNLIAWGDYLFRQDSMESTNEATQMYVLAAEILGPRPKKIPPQAKPSVESFNELEQMFENGKNSFGVPLVEVENLVPLLPGNGQAGSDQAPLPMLYFCIPQNDKMLGYWDTVADRLYKLRHCMNIEGVVRQLALFEPPIDPGALVKAVAGGVDISSALADLNAPLPLYRFNVLLQKANEVCNDVKALGGALLAALEKKDAEALGLLRQSQEIRVLEAVKAVKKTQIEEAKQNLEEVKRSKATVKEKRNFYRDIKKVITWEKVSMGTHGLGITSELAATVLNATAGTAHLVPDITVGVSGFGGSPLAIVKYGGQNVGSSAFNWAAFFSGLGGTLHAGANIMATQASHERRWDDWKLQEALANKELDRIDKSIAAAELRIAIAEKELKNQTLQIENAKATDEFMRSKYTNEELYQWQVGQISGVYFQSYKLAYDLAKRAERSFRFELGLQDSSYISFGYWDSLKKGLLSGEKLQYDLRRLETAYLDQNRREFELTRHISLALLDPLALVKLRETGRCFIDLPEEIFDLDFPGHYFRRIKSVSLTLPCVVGPYTTISCTLRLLKNSIRINTANGDNVYPRNTDDNGLPADDDRFIENNIPVKAVAVSSAQNDSGMFELNFRDERYLPFEGAGTISSWSLELFNDLASNNPDYGKPLRQFDYNTISDAILHIKYTSKEDAGPFKNGAITHLRKYFSKSQDGATHSLRLFNLKQEFPTQWQRFLHPANPADGNVFELEMKPGLFPILSQGKTLKVNTIWLLARCTNTKSYKVVMNPPVGADKMSLALSTKQYGSLYFMEKDASALDIKIVPEDAPVTWRIKMTSGGGNLQEDEVEDLMLILGYAL